MSGIWADQRRSGSQRIFLSTAASLVFFSFHRSLSAALYCPSAAWRIWVETIVFYFIRQTGDSPHICEPLSALSNPLLPLPWLKEQMSEGNCLITQPAQPVAMYMSLFHFRRWQILSRRRSRDAAPTCWAHGHRTSQGQRWFWKRPNKSSEQVHTSTPKDNQSARNMIWWLIQICLFHRRLVHLDHMKQMLNFNTYSSACTVVVCCLCVNIPIKLGFEFHHVTLRKACFSVACHTHFKKGPVLHGSRPDH